jgi:hypothetical protein
VEELQNPHSGIFVLSASLPVGGLTSEAAHPPTRSLRGYRIAELPTTEGSSITKRRETQAGLQRRVDLQRSKHAVIELLGLLLRIP